jgi:flagellar biosynthesis protein FlhF
MNLKTFIAKDMKSALEKIRAELGENAVIVASRKSKDGGVMVRAAIEESETPPEAAPVSPLESYDDRYRQGLVAKLRAKPAANAVDAELGRLPVNRATLLGILRAERAPDTLAHALAEQAEKSGLADAALALASALDLRMKTAPLDLAACKALLLAGPPGAGRTTVAAKLAAHARLARREVRLIATDTRGAGGLARLETFATHLDASLFVAEDGKSFAKLVEQSAKDGALVIADTCGFDPRAQDSWRDFLSFGEAPGVEIVGVLSALSDAEEAAEMAAALKELGAERLIVTGLDNVRRRGAVIALGASGLAVAQVSRSPFLAEGLEPLTPLGLAREITARALSAEATRRGRLA